MPLTVTPAALAAAAAALAGYGSSLATTTAGAAAPTTIIAPAGADTVSIQQAPIFSAFGAQLQAILAEGQDYQSQFETNLGQASDTYSFTEATNAAQAALSNSSLGAAPAAAADPPAANALDIFQYLLGGTGNYTSSSMLGGMFGLSGNGANMVNIGAGNWSSAASDLLGMAGGGLLPAAAADTGDAAAAAGAADLAASTAPAGAGMAGMGAMPVAAGMGQATMVGNLSAPPSWAGSVTPVVGTSAAPLETVGWTAAVPQAGTGTIVPGMPGMASGARSSAGFGAPRYGVKPIVMPKPATV